MLRNPQQVKASAPTTPSPTSSVQTRQSWAPRDFSSAILPPFPSTLASLEPITVLSAEAAKRPSSTVRAPSAARWSPCTLVFTLFKVTLNGDEVPGGGDAERTVAHVHVYSKAPNFYPHGPGAGQEAPAFRRSKSSAGFHSDPSSGRVEIERRWISRFTTASICDDHTDADGRAVVMRIIWGDEEVNKSSEWLVEMKNGGQLHEWIRQIKKTSIMINAEELGYGRAIRPAFEAMAVTADDLAHQLSVHARAVAGQREKAETPAPQEPVQGGERSASLEATTQGAVLARSHSADDLELRNSSLGRPLRKVGSEDKVQPPPVSDIDYGANDNTLGGLSLGGLNLGSGLVFPAPPSDLPSPRRARHAGVNKLVSNPVAMSSTPVLSSTTSASSPDRQELLDDEPIPRPPTPPRSAKNGSASSPHSHLMPRGKAPSIASTNNSGSSSTRALRRLRGKPQVIDISESRCTWIQASR